MEQPRDSLPTAPSVLLSSKNACLSSSCKPPSGTPLPGSAISGNYVMASAVALSTDELSSKNLQNASSASDGNTLPAGAKSDGSTMNPRIWLNTEAGPICIDLTTLGLNIVGNPVNLDLPSVTSRGHA